MTGKTARNTLAVALHAAICSVRRFSVGRITRTCCNWREGDFVLVDESGDSLVVSSPMTPVEIKREKANGSLLVDICTTIGVPSNYVEIMLSAEEIRGLRNGAK